MSLVFEIFKSIPERSGDTLSIREQGLEWAKGYLEQNGVGLNDLVLVTPVVAAGEIDVMTLPPLLGDNYALRVDDLGYIYHQSWRSIRPEAAQARADNYKLLFPRQERVGLDYLHQIPARKSAVMVWQPVRHDSIETAIMAQEHILQKVVSGRDNSDLTQTVGVIRGIDNFSKIVLSGQVTEETLAVLADKTSEMLEANRLTRPQATAKIKMTDQLKAAFRKDSLNRINPLVTQIRLRSAYLEAVLQLVKVSKVAEKYTLNQVQLEWVRELDRWALATAAEFLDRKILWHAGFEKYSFESFDQRQVLEMIITGMAHKLLTIPRERPYLPLARLAALALVGCHPDKVGLNQAIIGNQDHINWLNNDLSVVQMIQRNDFQQAGIRVEAVRSQLLQGLEN